MSARVSPSLVKFLSPLMAAVFLLPSLSYGLACVEFMEATGKPAALPMIERLTLKQVSGITLIRPSIGIKPHLELKGDGNVLMRFPGIPKNEPQIFSAQSPRRFVRPDVEEIQGYKRYLEKLPSSEEGTESSPPLIQGKVRSLIYGMEDSGTPLLIQLSADEIPVSALRLGESARLVATIEVDFPIGFQANGLNRKETYLVQVYYLDAGGYSAASFRVPKGKVLPKVEFFASTEKTGLVLTVDKKFYSFKLAMVKAGQ